MIYSKYTCKDGDRIDLIVKSHYGTINNLNLVLEHNPILLKNSMTLTSGTVVKLPVIAENTKTVTDAGVNTVRKPLW